MTVLFESPPLDRTVQSGLASVMALCGRAVSVQP